MLKSLKGSLSHRFYINPPSRLAAGIYGLPRFPLRLFKCQFTHANQQWCMHVIMLSSMTQELKFIKLAKQKKKKKSLK